MQLIKLKEVINKTCLSRSSIYDYVDRGLFPKPVKLGARSVAWVLSEVDEWILIRINDRNVFMHGRHVYHLCRKSKSPETARKPHTCTNRKQQGHQLRETIMRRHHSSIFLYYLLVFRGIRFQLLLQFRNYLFCETPLLFVFKIFLKKQNL